MQIGLILAKWNIEKIKYADDFDDWRWRRLKELWLCQGMSSDEDDEEEMEPEIPPAL